MAVPGWVAIPLFRLLRAMRGVRGGPLDVCRGLSAGEREVDYRVMAELEADCEHVVRALERTRGGGGRGGGGGGGGERSEVVRASRELLAIPLQVAPPLLRVVRLRCAAAGPERVRWSACVSVCLRVSFSGSIFVSLCFSG
eukprot:3500417-Rhodomonas_salina.2